MKNQKSANKLGIFIGIIAVIAIFCIGLFVMNKASASTPQNLTGGKMRNFTGRFNGAFIGRLGNFSGFNRTRFNRYSMNQTAIMQRSGIISP